MTAHEPLAFYLAAKNAKSAKRRDRTEPPGRTVESWVHLELRISNLMLMSFMPVLSLRSLRSLRLNPSVLLAVARHRGAHRHDMVLRIPCGGARGGRVAASLDHNGKPDPDPD